MANQYCKITSWIKHHSPHGDPKYAEAISDLCLDSALSPSKYAGLTYLYQTNDKIRKKFYSHVFSANAHELCKEFKRYVLPDIFHSCEDFEKKEVGNIMKEKYEVKSCDKNSVTFTNGMKIKSIPKDSYEPLSTNLKNIVKIYYVVEGEPPSDGPETYHIQHSTHKTKKGVRGGTGDEFESVYTESNLGEEIKKITYENIKQNAYTAFGEVLKLLENELDNAASSHGDTAASSHGDTAASSHEDTEASSHEDKHGGDEQLVNNIKNLILAQWLTHSICEGIISYIYICLFILYHSNKSEPFKLIVSKTIMKILEVINGNSGDKGHKSDYFHHIVEISKIRCDFSKAENSIEANNKAKAFIKSLYGSGQKTELLGKFYERISISPTIWGDYFFPTFLGSFADNIVQCGTYLALWAITIFTVNSNNSELPHSDRMGLLDEAFIKIIRSTNTHLDINYIFSEESLRRILAGPQQIESGHRNETGEGNLTDTDATGATGATDAVLDATFGGGRGRRKKNIAGGNRYSGYDNYTGGGDMFD